MKKICGTITILILAAAMIALTACSNVLDPPQSKREAETGTVYIVIDGDSSGNRSAARTLAPEPANFTRYTVSFSGPEPHGDVEISGSTSVNLVPGEWIITVTAAAGSYPSYNAAGRGSAIVTVLYNQTVAADITITPITGGGQTGDFRYSVTVPSVDSAVLSLTNMTTNMTISGMPINLKEAADSFGGIAEATLNLDAGYYLMNILLEKSGTYAGRTEVAHIYDGLETAAVYTFTDNDFGLVVESLTDGVWQGGEITASGSEYYRLPVTTGKTYAVYWNSYNYGDGTKTLYSAGVSAYYETDMVSIFSGVNKGYTTPQVFTATSSGNVIIRVEPYAIGSTGTYAVMYGEVRPLGSGITETETITTGGVKLYSFSVDANTMYEVTWEDSGDQIASSSFNGDIKVTAYRESIGSSYVLFNAVDSGYTTPRTVSYTSDATIYLKVDGVTDGTYSINAQQPVQHIITFDADGGSPATQTRTVNYGRTIGSSNMPAEPTKNGYGFGGWHTGQNGSGTEFTDSTTVTGSITVYAQWNPGIPVAITLQPVPSDPQLSGVTVSVDQSAAFDVATGYAAYAWYWDSAFISGATSYSYTLTANSKPAGIYELSVVVTDNAGERLSARCQVTITAQ